MTRGRPAGRDLRDLLRLVGLDRPRFLLTTALGVVTVLAGAALLALSGYLICRAAQQPPILTLGVLMVAVRAVALVRPGARYGERLAGHDLAFRSLGRLRTFVFRRIEPLAPAELEQYRDGELLGRMVGDIDELQDLVLRILLPVAIGIPAAALIVALTALWAPGPSLVLGIGLLVGAVVPPLLSHRVTVRTQDHQTGLRATLTADLVDALQAAPELWLNGADDRVAAALAADDRVLVDAARRDARIAGAADAGAVAITGLTGLAVLVAATAAAGAGNLDPLLVAPVTLVALASFEAVDPLAVAARHLPSVLGAGARVLDLVERHPSVTDPDVPHAPPGRRPDVQLQGVVVSRGRERVRVLDGLDLHVRPGERVVVQGPSGSGKSTALLVLVRFLERDAGDARLDGVDLRDFAQDDLRHEVLLLDQDPHVFNSDIRENVAFARPGSDDAAILAALDRARLGDWVTSLPDGLDTRVGELGRALSGGQRQRLALARAFLADPSVLLLDEPTAHLDAPTADALLADLAAEAGSRSIVLVSHGHEAPFAADRTVVVEAGRARPGVTGGC